MTTALTRYSPYEPVAAKCIFVHWLTPPLEAAHAGWKRARASWNNPVITSSTSTQHPNNSSRCHILPPPPPHPRYRGARSSCGAAPPPQRAPLLNTGPSFAPAPFHSINTSCRMTFNIVNPPNGHFWGRKNCMYLNQVCKYPVFTASLRKCCAKPLFTASRQLVNKQHVALRKKLTILAALTYNGTNSTVCRWTLSVFDKVANAFVVPEECFNQALKLSGDCFWFTLFITTPAVSSWSGNTC